jgi:MEDS: MEthanogen/methylotroph, DcmR Sensory domain
VTSRDCVLQSNVMSEHIVQLFDSGESLAASVSRFLGDGYALGETLLAVMVPDHWELTAQRLARHGLPVDEALATGRLTVLDASGTLKQLMRNGSLDIGLFDRTAGAMIRELRSRGAHLRIYGEMVDLLSAAGDFRSAQELEDLWNDLGDQESFTLLCGYSSASFGDPGAADALRLICRAHSHVRSNPRDVLGAYLLQANY